MKTTYDEAMARVFEDEGGYSNDPGDPGGPTNWGITIADARHYWKHDATAADVRNMPKPVAEAIYAAHYAAPMRYDDLPPGVDYAVLDYGINSGIFRSAKVLQELVGVPEDGSIGPQTVAATQRFSDPTKLIAEIYDERLRFLMGLKTWRIFGGGWGRRVRTGKTAALGLWSKHKAQWAPPLTNDQRGLA
jgi:lysozyme family protein